MIRLHRVAGPPRLKADYVLMAEESGRRQKIERTSNDDAPHTGGSDLDYFDAESGKFKYEEFKYIQGP